VKYRDSEGLKVLKEVLKLEGSNLKVKLKCFKGRVFQRVEFQRVGWYLTGSQR
jgi:hypothetical protein